MKSELNYLKKKINNDSDNDSEDKFLNKIKELESYICKLQIKLKDTISSNDEFEKKYIELCNETNFDKNKSIEITLYDEIQDQNLRTTLITNDMNKERDLLCTCCNII